MVGFDTLPDEILQKIFNLVMDSDVAVEFDTVNLDRDCKDFPSHLDDRV